MVTKSLRNRVRGWFPQEPTLKTPVKTQLAPVNNNLSFKVRRWLHGTSAFITALLWRQRSRRFKMQSMLYGFFIFSSLLLLVLFTNKMVSYYWVNFGQLLLFLGFFSLSWVIDLYLKKRETQNQPRQNFTKAGGTIVCLAGVGVLIYSTYLLDFVYPNSTPEGASTLPFYLGLVGLFMLLLGWGLSVLGRKPTKIVANLGK